MQNHPQVRLAAGAVALVLGVLSGCASTPTPAPEPEQPTQPRMQRAGYAETACQSGAAFGLISAIGLPGYMVVSSFANRACSAMAASND